MTFEAKQSLDLILKLGCPNLHAVTINRKYS